MGLDVRELGSHKNFEKYCIHSMRQPTNCVTIFPSSGQAGGRLAAFIPSFSHCYISFPFRDFCSFLLKLG